MKKNIILILVTLLFILTSCKEQQIEPPTIDCETNPEHESCKEEPIENKVNCKKDRNNELCLDPEYWSWEYNENKYDGKGQTINIYHLDHYDDTLTVQEENRIRKINKEYNVSLDIKDYPECVEYGKGQIEYIKDKPDGIYVVDSSLVKTLVEEDLISPLDEIMGEINYIQDEHYNRLTRVENKIYGYNPKVHYPDSYLFYNQDMVKEYGLEDPAVLWNKGEWTWSKFVEVMKGAYENKDANVFVFGARDLIGFVSAVFAATGIDEINNKEILVDEQIMNGYKILQEVARIDENYFWHNMNSSGVAVTPSLQNNQLIFSTGSLGKYYDIGIGEYYDVNISAVPYPRADDDPNLEKYQLLTNSSEVLVFGKDTKIPTEILVNIIDDLTNGIKPTEKLKQESFESYIRGLIKSEESIKALLSVYKTTEKINFWDYTTYYIGNGIDPFEHSYKVHINSIIYDKNTSETMMLLLNIKNEYQKALEELNWPYQ